MKSQLLVCGYTTMTPWDTGKPPNSTFHPNRVSIHRAYDWQQIMGDFGAAATAFALDTDLL